MTNAVRLADKVRDLIAAASSWDCEDIPRGPCESRAGLSPSTWCAPCLARALAAEADRMGAGDGEVRGMAEEALRLDERHRVLCDLMEQRRGGSEAHGEIMSIDGKLRGLALKMSRAVLDSARVEGGGGGEERPMLTEWARVPLSATMHARCEDVLGGMMVGVSAHADGQWRVNAPGEVPARQVARGTAPDLAAAKRDADLAALQWYQFPASRAGGGR
jgi:hypothetical protein